jgi:hypothetical protein
MRQKYPFAQFRHGLREVQAVQYNSGVYWASRSVFSHVRGEWQYHSFEPGITLDEFVARFERTAEVAQ